VAEISELKWYGDDIKRKVLRACVIGVNRTMAVAVAEAKETHPFTNQTGTAERSIRIAGPAEVRGDDVVGIWGSVACSYFIFLEFGTSLMRGAKAKAYAAGRVFQGMRVDYATLRPTAAKVHPLLGRMVNAAYRSL